MDKVSRKTRNHVPTPLNQDPNVSQINTCGETLIYTSSYGPSNHPRTWVNILTKRTDFDNPSRLDHIYYCCPSIWMDILWSATCGNVLVHPLASCEKPNSIEHLEVQVLLAKIRKVPGGRDGYHRSKFLFGSSSLQ